MADRLWRVQCTIPLDSGIPEDAIVNTWHFDDDDDPLAAPEHTGGWIIDMLDAFYTPVSSVLFPSTADTTVKVKMYDLADPEPRVPVHTGSFAISSTGGPPMVAEAALCLSYAAAVGSGDNVRRRRGRIFLGPVAAGAGTVVGGQVRPTAAVMTAVADAAATLRDGFLHPASPGYRLHWAVYSPTEHAASTIGAAFNDVETGWVDDAFDTQRRRGPKPTTRTTF